MRIFHIVLLGLFAVFLVTGVLMFSLFRGQGADRGETFVVWGTISAETFFKFLDGAVGDSRDRSRVEYVEKRAAAFDQEFVEALAEGNGPDLILLPHDLILRHQKKILPIPYVTFPLREFKDTFVEGAEIYLSPAGIMALPLSVDPLVMYWNRDRFADDAIALPPRTWNEVLTLTQTLTKTDRSLNILKSGVALGEVRNIENAKEILSALFFQTGNPIVSRAEGENLIVTLSERGGEEVLTFYTEFANPVKPIYSWNRSLPAASRVFSSGDLAIFFGFASELSTLRERNPNLNFDVARFPQSHGARNKVTFARFLGIAVVRGGVDPSGATGVALQLTSAQGIESWSAATGLPPVRRLLLLPRPDDQVASLFYEEALRSRAWLDLDPRATTLVFSSMVESVTAGRLRVGEALRAAAGELSALLIR